MMEHERMTTGVRRSKRAGSIPREPAVIYCGIKIVAIEGKRSPVAEYIRDALRAKAAEHRAGV